MRITPVTPTTPPARIPLRRPPPQPQRNPTHDCDRRIHPDPDLHGDRGRAYRPGMFVNIEV
jgi:hypothetical protein